MAVEVENLFTLDPGQIFIVRDAFAWRAFISKWNPFFRAERCVFRLCVPNKRGGGRRGGIKFRGVVFFFFSEIWVDLLECSLFHFFFYFYLTFSPYIIVYHYTVIILYQINYSFVDIYLQSAFLEVVIPPDIISEETSNDLMVPEGGSAKLVCKARGYPKPDIVWKREDGAEIISRAGLSGGKTKSEYNYISIVIYFRSKCTLLARVWKMME